MNNENIFNQTMMLASYPTNDPEIRKAFHTKRLMKAHISMDAMVIDELCAYRKRRKDPGSRIDIAVVDDCIHGYEIKSSTDTLKRLPLQLETYRLCFEKLTFITAEKHRTDLERLLPDWCGIVLTWKGARGGVYFKTVRASGKNPEVDVLAMTYFLWRKELLACIRQHNKNKLNLKGRKSLLRRRLSKLVSVEQISPFIKKSFMAREDWRTKPMINRGSC